MLAGSGDLPVLGLAGGRLLVLAASAGREVHTEAFPDRASKLGPDGVRRLVPRDRPGAVLTDPHEIAARAVQLAAEADSVCVHGDSPRAVETARAVRAALTAAGWTLRPFR